MVAVHLNDIYNLNIINLNQEKFYWFLFLKYSNVLRKVSSIYSIFFLL